MDNVNTNNANNNFVPIAVLILVLMDNVNTN